MTKTKQTTNGLGVVAVIITLFDVFFFQSLDLEGEESDKEAVLTEAGEEGKEEDDDLLLLDNGCLLLLLCCCCCVIVVVAGVVFVVVASGGLWMVV